MKEKTMDGDNVNDCLPTKGRNDIDDVYLIVLMLSSLTAGQAHL